MSYRGHIGRLPKPGQAILVTRNSSATTHVRYTPQKPQDIQTGVSYRQCIYAHHYFYPSAIFWSSRGHMCRPVSPPVSAFTFIAKGSAFPPLVDFHQMLLFITHVLALPAYQVSIFMLEKVPTSRRWVRLEPMKPILVVGTRTIDQANGEIAPPEQVMPRQREPQMVTTFWRTLLRKLD